jgi:hypothetical protein
MMIDTSSRLGGIRYTDETEDDIDFTKKGQFNKIYFEKPNEVTDTLNLARALFDLREYRKAAHILKPIANPKN